MNNIHRPIIVFIFMFALLYCGILSAKTTLTITSPAAGITGLNAEAAKLEQQFQDKMDKNGPFWADAYAFSNTVGYATGKAYLGDFPHFEAGVMMNAGLTNTTNFQYKKNGIYDGTTPGIGFYPSFRFGLGLGGGFDTLFKFYSLNKDVYTPKLKFKRYEIKNFSFYNIGGRLRYNLVKEKTLVPVLFTFGGITLATGADFSRGIIDTAGKYDMQFKNIDVSVSGVPTTVTPTLSSDYTCAIKWYQVSWSSSALIYFDVLKVFSFYTGTGLSIGYGSFTTEFNANGDLVDSTVGNVGTVQFTSKNKYHPYKVIPAYIIGLQINLPLIKIVSESQVNLKNRKDVTVSFGSRFEI